MKSAPTVILIVVVGTSHELPDLALTLHPDNETPADLSQFSTLFVVSSFYTLLALHLKKALPHRPIFECDKKWAVIAFWILTRVWQNCPRKTSWLKSYGKWFYPWKCLSLWKQQQQSPAPIYTWCVLKNICINLWGLYKPRGAGGILEKFAFVKPKKHGGSMQYAEFLLHLKN